MDDWLAFCGFMGALKPPRLPSEATVDDAVEFLRTLPSDRINKAVTNLSAAQLGNQKENPFSSAVVRTFLKERMKKEKESQIKGDYDKEIFLEKCLTDSDVGQLDRLVILADKHSPLVAHLSGILEFEDEDGKLWRFSFSYVRQSYVFTQGWSSYVREKQLRAGDFVFFQRHRRDSNRLFIGCRRRNEVALGQRDYVHTESISPATSSVQGRSTLGQRDYVHTESISPATSSVQGRSALGQQRYILLNSTSPATSSSVHGRSTLGQPDNVLSDQAYSEMLEDETPLQLRLPEHSNTEFDPILVIFCGDNQDSEESYFISYIFKELCLRGFTPLKYDLTRSTVTGDQKMLYSCRVGIIILSENYVRSRECLDGFLAIMDHLKANNLELMPVFFKVRRSHVRYQSGSFGTTFLQLGKSVQASHVQRWRDAMIKLTSIKYYVYMKGHEVMLAKNIVRDVCLLLNSETNGIELALKSILPLLDCSQPSAPHIVGLWGMAGIGKTTTAREIFRRQAQRYDVCYFLPDFDLMCQTKGLGHLHDEFFSKILGEENVFIDACDTKLSFLRDRFLDRRVLIVLDGVSNARDAEVLVGGFGWFSGGHTIILTSRNRQVLVQCNAKEIYEIPKLSESESLRLCCQFATEEDWMEKRLLISELVNYASGNPLALRVLGLSIQKKSIYNEKQHLIILRQHPLIEIQDAFRRSFNVLDDNEKNAFLDLACFFRGENKDCVVNILDGCGMFTDIGICGLIDESLISLVDNKIEIPNIFQDMGRFIVYQEDEDAGKRSRLWDTYDITDVLTKKIGTEAIEGIVFDMSLLTLELSSSVFEKMYRLRLLKLYCQTFASRIFLPQGLHSLPDELRLLHWERYPLGSLPRNFNPKNLVELNMPYSTITKLWKGTKNLEKLKRIILRHSRQLTEFPRLSKAINLEHIDLEGCTSLVKVNSSILHHQKLKFLSLKDCSRLRIMPTTVHLESLDVLNLSGCSELEDLQDFSPNLKKLYLAGTAITEIPSSIGNLTKLVIFDLENCNRLQDLPPEISNLKAVVTRRTKRPASSMNLSSVEDKAPPCKRSRLKRVIESVILGLRKRKQQTSVSSHKSGSDFTLVNDPSYKSLWGFPGLSESSGQLKCQAYMMTGYCIFGNGCIYLHPRNRETNLLESSSSMASETPHLNRLRVLPLVGTSSFVSDITQATVGIDTNYSKPRTSVPKATNQVYSDDETDSASSACMSDDQIDSDS